MTCCKGCSNVLHKISHLVQAFTLLLINNFLFLEITYQFKTRPQATLLKKRLWHRCFHRCFVNFAKFLRTPFLQNICGRLLLVFLQKILVFALTYPLKNLFSKFDQPFWDAASTPDPVIILSIGMMDYQKENNVERRMTLVQKQSSEVFCKKGVLRNFAKFTGKQDVFLWILRNF